MDIMVKLVDVYIASLWRQGHVVKTVKSLLLNPEVGTITISCNNYTDKQWRFVSKHLKDKRVKLHRTNNEKGSNEKLRFINDGDNYYICLVDDDLIYPPGFLKKLIDGCKKYNAHVSIHGRILKDRPLSSYYNGAKETFRSLGTVAEDVEVDIASNCGLLFKRNFYDNLSSWYGFCGTTSMDDIYVSYFAKSSGIKQIVLAHSRGYVKHKKKHSDDDYVFSRYVHNNKVQTDFINKYF